MFLRGKLAEPLMCCLPNIMRYTPLGTVLAIWLVSLACIVWAKPARVADQYRWMQEIERSLQRDIRGCPYNRTYRLYSNRDRSHEYFRIQAVLPSRETLGQFSGMRAPLTKVNPSFPVIASMIGANETYRNKTRPSWVRLRAHPGQQYRQIYDLIQTAAQRPVAAFEGYGTIKRAFYVAKIYNAIVHADGSVGAGCGRLIGVDGCETRWDRQYHCHKACLAYIRENNKHWLDIWNTSVSDADRLALIHQCDCIPDDRRPGPPPGPAIGPGAGAGPAMGPDSSSGSVYPLNISHSYKVFIADAFFDTNYYHMLTDSLARVVHFIPFLKNNKNIKIHILADEYFTPPVFPKKQTARIRAAQHMRAQLLDLLGISSERLVSQVVIADVVYAPRTMFCAHVATNPVETRLLASQLLIGVYKYLDTRRHLIPAYLLEVFLQRREQYLHANMRHIVGDLFQPVGNAPKVMLIIQRLCKANRCWSDDTTQSVTASLAMSFPNHKVQVLRSDDNKKSDYCFPCELFLYSAADILIGEHGAGLTNVMFMKVESMLIEVVGGLDSRSFPLSGYYSAMAGGFGIHNYIHAHFNKKKEYKDPNQEKEKYTEFPAIPLQADRLAYEARWFYDVIHTST